LFLNFLVFGGHKRPAVSAPPFISSPFSSYGRSILSFPLYRSGFDTGLGFGTSDFRH
jgi:hypothetical protein